MEIGIAYDLKEAVLAEGTATAGPEDRLEEYDSEETIDGIARALAANGHTPRKLGGGRRFVEEMMRRPPELVFNIAEGVGTRSREAHVPAVAEMLRVPITHSDPLTLAVALDKAMAKRLVAAAGVPTPAFQVLDRADQALDLPLPFPLLAKPLYEGSSMGVRKTSRAIDAKALREQVEWLLEAYHQPVLVEEFCAGPEFTVGILGTDASAKVIAVMEILPKRMKPEEFVYSLEVKRNYQEEVEYRVPPERPATLIKAAEEVALKAYRALGCRDVGRVDLRTDARGQPKFLEINPLPGLNPVTGDLVILSERSGLSYQALIGRIVDGARDRTPSLARRPR